MTKILLLGGHGKVSLLMTPKLLARSWNVTSVIRNPDQTPAILALGKNQPGKIDTLISSIQDVKTIDDAGEVIDKAGNIDWVVWSAGAGGQGGADRTNAIDRDACIQFIRASIARPRIKKFLLVSALIIRREKAPWWDEEGWGQVQKVNKEVMPAYCKAKLAADEVITVEGKERKDFGWIVLRPGNLTDEPESGQVHIGKTAARGTVSRADVADVAGRLLEREGISGWFDLLGGGRSTADEVERVVSSGEDSVEGADLGVMKDNIGKYE